MAPRTALQRQPRGRRGRPGESGARSCRRARASPLVVAGLPQTGAVPPITALIEPSRPFWAREAANV